jgi:hypothetical protein
MIDDLEDQLGKYYDRHGKTYDEIMRKTKLQTDHMLATKHLEFHHIDYDVPQDDPVKKQLYTQFIAKECHLRGIRTIGSQLEKWRSALQMSITMEKYIVFLLNVRKWKDEGVEKVPLVKVVELPYIMHPTLGESYRRKIYYNNFTKGHGLIQGPKRSIHSICRGRVSTQNFRYGVITFTLEGKVL